MKIKCGCGSNTCSMVMTLVMDADGEVVFVSIHKDTEDTPNMVLKVKEAKKLRKYLRKYIDNVRAKEDHTDECPV